MAGEKYLSDGRTDGTIINRSGEKIGFFGTTPVASQTVSQTSATLAGVNGTTAVIATGATAYGYSTVTQANEIISQLNKAITDIDDIKDALVAYGLVTAG